MERSKDLVELFRTSDYLSQWKRDSTIQMQNVMLIASLEMRDDLIEIVKNV